MIFARRSIQTFIDKLSEKLSRDTVGKLVRSLNRNDHASLGFEWETAVLFALNQLGELGYEANHGGNSLPDVTFYLPGQNKVSFIADIATVSDRGLEDENPVGMFMTLFQEKARDLGLVGGFEFRIEGTRHGKGYQDYKVKLLIPRRNELSEYLEKHITPKLQAIKETGLDKAEIALGDPYKISVSYRRDTNISASSYPSYTTAYSLARNPIYTTLKTKARQLSRSGFKGRKGIILCDGSCSLLGDRSSGHISYSDQQIIENFLRQHTSISFVATLWVEQPDRVFLSNWQRPQLQIRAYRNPYAKFLIDDNSVRILRAIPSLLPIPVNTALNAANGIKHGKSGIGDSFYGGSSMTYDNFSNTVKISSRSLLELLAGKRDSKEYIHNHWSKHSGKGGDISNPFEVALHQGMTIKSASIEYMEQEDDDWITFKLSGPDPAVKPFRSRASTNERPDAKLSGANANNQQK